MISSLQAEAWLLTLAVEAGAAAPLAVLCGLAWHRGAAAAVLGSLVSHPIVWAGFFALTPKIGYWGAFSTMEAFAVLFESAYYALIAGARWPAAIGLSFAVNAASVLIGFILQWSS